MKYLSWFYAYGALTTWISLSLSQLLIPELLIVSHEIPHKVFTEVKLLLQWWKLQVSSLVENVTKISIESSDSLLWRWCFGKWPFFFKREVQCDKNTGGRMSVGLGVHCPLSTGVYCLHETSSLTEATQSHLCWRLVCEQIPFSNGNLDMTPSWRL